MHKNSSKIFIKLYLTYLDSTGSTINFSKATTGPFATCNLTESMLCLVALDAAEKPTNCAANGALGDSSPLKIILIMKKLFTFEYY